MRLLASASVLGLVCCIGCGEAIKCPTVPLVENGTFAALEHKLVQLTTQIVVVKEAELYPRQCYFGEAHIDFGNYYNHRYHFTHEEFLVSTDTIFDQLDRNERERLLKLSEEMLNSGAVNAEYSYRFGRYLFLVVPSGEYEEQVFMMGTNGLDMAALQDNKALLVLCSRNGYVFFRHLH